MRITLRTHTLLWTSSPTINDLVPSWMGWIGNADYTWFQYDGAIKLHEPHTIFWRMAELGLIYRSGEFLWSERRPIKPLLDLFVFFQVFRQFQKASNSLSHNRKYPPSIWEPILAKIMENVLNMPCFVWTNITLSTKWLKQSKLKINIVYLQTKLQQQK